MKSLEPLHSRGAGKALAGMLVLSVLLLGCPTGRRPLAPASGLPQFQEPAVVPVPGARVNTLGGNLMVRRVDLSIDTRLGTQEIGAFYNGASGTWTWSFDLRYDGETFVDPTGALHDVGELAPGDAIPGTVWVVVDGDTVKTKGGLAHDFDPGGRLAAIHWTSSDHPRLETRSAWIGGESRITELRQCATSGACSEVFNIDYEATGRVRSIRDRAGRLAEFSHDAHGRLRVARDGLDTARGWPGHRYEYAGTALTAIVNSEDERTEYAYDGNRRIVEVRAVGAGDSVYRFSYQGRKDGLYRTRVWNPLDQESRYRYDGKRRLREFELVGTAEQTRYAWSGRRITSEIQPDGATTTRSYVADDLATETQASGNVVRWEYETEGVDRDAPFERAVLSVHDDLGLREARSYDAEGRLISVTNGAGETTTYGYGEDQLVSSLSTPDGVVRTYSDHGEHGHPLRISLGDAEERRVFDAVGNLLEGSDDFEPLPGGLVSRVYDEDRNLSGILMSDLELLGTTSTTGWVTLEHRSDGQWTRILRPGGGDHELAYDALGRMAERRERVDGQWQVTRFEHDAAGRLTAREQPNGMRQEFGYDVAGRVTSEQSFRDGIPEGSLTYTYAAGRLKSISDSSRAGTERHFYDAAGRLFRIRFPQGEELFLLYDARSRRIQETYVMPGPRLLRQLDFGFDAADREVSISEHGEALLERVYQNGQLVETRYGNGLVRSHDYDAMDGLLVSSSTLDAASRLLEETSIVREVVQGFYVHARIGVTTTTNGGVEATTREEYGLAPILHRAEPLSEAGKRAWYWLSGEDLDYFAYDELGNLAQTHLGGSFVYNPERNRLLRADPDGSGPIEYAYDEAGYVTSRGGVPITWTASGRMASFGTEIQLEWDMLGRLISSSVAGVTRRWRFGGRILADADGAPAAIDLGEVQIELASGERRYRHFDFRGNVKFVSDAQGEVIAHYRYSPYGVAEILGADDDAVRFVGRIQMGELMILGARIYDAAVGRFLSPDPILNAVNQHAYVLGNPVLFSDPDGLEGITVGTLVVTIAAGVIAAYLLEQLGSIAAFYAAMVLLAYVIGRGNASSSGVATLSGLSQAASSSGAGGGACAPVALTATPRATLWLMLLLPLQILLGLLLLRERRRRP